MTEIVTGDTIASSSVFYYAVGMIVIMLTAVIAFGGIKKVTRWTDKMVPIMAIVYIVTVLVLVLINFKEIPYFSVRYFGEHSSRMHFWRSVWNGSCAGCKERIDV